MVSLPPRLSLAVLLGLAACQSGPTAPSVADLQRAQADWASHNLTRYAYRYETTGFLIVWSGQAMRLVVLSDTVRSAQYVATNDSVPVVPASLPTVDALFALAIAAREDGKLVSVQFDATFGYPTRLVLAGPPDASGTILASNIELLP
jgi:hypothetical protein